MNPGHLQGAVHPAEALLQKTRERIGRFRQGDRPILVDDAVAHLQDRERQVRVFGERAVAEAAGLQDEAASPGADRARHDRDAIHEAEGAAVEVLAGNVFQRLKARQGIHAVADFGIAGDRADLRIGERRHQSFDAVDRENRIRVEADDDLGVRARDSEIQRRRLAAVLF